MKLSVADIRRASKDIAVYQPVSITALAMHLRACPQLVRRYVHGVAGLQEEIDACSGAHKRTHQQYIQAVQQLERAGVRVTASRIARCTKSTTRAVQMWLQRHPEYRLAVVSRNKHKALLMRERIVWLRNNYPSITVVALARYLGKSRQHVHRHLGCINRD